MRVAIPSLFAALFEWKLTVRSLKDMITAISCDVFPRSAYMSASISGLFELLSLGRYASGRRACAARGLEEIEAENAGRSWPPGENRLPSRHE
jgi:hypothetical protein